MKPIVDKEVTGIQTKEGYLTLKGLFIPFFVENLLMNLMGTVNTLVLGHYSDDAVAAVGAANQVMGLIYTFYAVISGGAGIVISHRLGAGNEKEAVNASFSALLFAGLLSIITSIALGACPEALMRLLNLKGETLILAVDYFKLIVRFSFVQCIISVLSATLRSFGHPKPAVAVSLLMNAINAGLNYLVVFRPFETPLVGTRGIAVSNVIARTTALVVMIFVMVFGPVRLPLSSISTSTFKSMKSILRVGIPGGVSNLSYSLSQVVSTSILGILGTTALSAKIYISNIVFYVYAIGYTLGLSTAVLVGWMAGAGEYDKAYRLNREVLKIAVTINIVFSSILFVAYKPILGLFTSNAEIIAMARWILLIDLFVEIFRAFNHIEDNSLRGAGDVVFPMIIAITSCWVMSILFSYVLGVKLGLGLYGCWIAFMLDEMFRGIILYVRFGKKKWMKMKV